MYKVIIHSFTWLNVIVLQVILPKINIQDILELDTKSRTDPTGKYSSWIQSSMKGAEEWKMILNKPVETFH